ncbi:YjbR protein [Rudaeicoccus suwonensis]|uniref:YjbR protein n=1 Tax=Rudaeicoccus suwonensis TaxID=657409 RepID=A0A561E6Q0_9MICO|nr:YjbR protein [Rudaeicoccus suwonensis]
MSRMGLSTYAVRGKTFAAFREPRKDAVDADGQLMEDVIVIRTAGQEDKAALLQSGPPWFTTAHFDGYAAVLVRSRDLDQLTVEELTEVITDAWVAKAPKRLASAYLATLDERG